LKYGEEQQARLRKLVTQLRVEQEDAQRARGGQKAPGERRRKRGRSVTFGTIEKRELGRGGGEFRHAVDGRKGPGGSGAWQSGVGGADDHSA
jgi:hypothetical protein